MLPCNTNGTEQRMSEWWLFCTIWLLFGLLVLYITVYFIVQTYRHIGTYNETLKCCLENYTELAWKSMQTSLVSFCQHLNGGATLVFVWCEFTHGQVWSSPGVVTGSCKEYTHSTACFTLVLTLCNRIINISSVYCLSPPLLWISLIQITISSIARFVWIAAVGAQNTILQKGKAVSFWETS